MLLGGFPRANVPHLIDFSLRQPTVQINVSMVAALLQTPVSVSLAGGAPTAPVVSVHLLLSVWGCLCWKGPLSADSPEPWVSRFTPMQSVVRIPDPTH